jgi:hypothetical protein
MVSTGSVGQPQPAQPPPVTAVPARLAGSGPVGVDRMVNGNSTVNLAGYFVPVGARLIG